MDCIYCGSPVHPERVELGKQFCMSDACVRKGLSGSMQEYRLVLVPKQGFTYVKSDDPFLLEGGRSSGRAT